VFENWFMRKIFGTVRAEVTGQTRGTQNEGFHDHHVLLEWSKHDA